MVLWHHALPQGSPVSYFLLRGFLGVDIFFVLSGYLITTVLLREAEAYGRFSLRDFYLRRILRILPPLYAIVTLVSLYFVWFQGRGELAELVPYYYLFLSNFLIEHIPTLSPTWSVSIEEQFYILWPLLLLLLPARLLVSVVLALIALNVSLAAGVFAIEPARAGPLVFVLPNATYAPLFLGALLAIALHSRDGFEIVARLFGHRTTALWGAGAFVICVALFPIELRGLPNLGLHLIITATLAALVIREDGFGHRVLQHPFAARIGKVSYGIYLYHLIALDISGRILTRLDLSGVVLMFFAYSALAYLMAEISFRTLEAYFTRFRPAARPAPSLHAPR